MISKKKKKKKKRSSPKFRVIFRPKSEIQTFFPPKIRRSKKKKKRKKGLRQNSEWFFGRNLKFKSFFRPKLGDLQKKKKKKKKKRSSPKFTAIFLPSFATSNVWGGALFVWGGLFSIFHGKSASKAQNTCVFAYFTSQWGGLEPPPPPPPWLRYWVQDINDKNLNWSLQNLTEVNLVR